MSTGVAVSLVIMASLGLAFVYNSSRTPQRIGPSKENMDELRQKLSVLSKAREAHRQKSVDDEIQKNQQAYDEYVSILKKKH